MSFCTFFGEGSRTEIDYRNNCTLIQTSLLKDLDHYQKINDTLFLARGAGSAENQLSACSPVATGVLEHN